MGGYCHYGKDKAIYRPPLSFRGAKRRGNPFSLCRKCIFVRCIGGADCEASLRPGFAMTGCFYAALSFPLCSSLSSGDPFGASCHCLAAARSRRGSDMPLACHSLPRRRFATLEGAALRGKDLGRSADFSCVAERKNGTVHAVPFTLFNSQIRRRG